MYAGGRRATRFVVGSVAALVAMAGLAGCGPASTVSFDVKAHCYALPGKSDEGIHTFHVRFTAPEWASPGETVRLGHMEITGNPIADSDDLEFAFVVPQGMTPVIPDKVPSGAIENAFVGPAAPPKTPADLGTASATLTAASGSYATLNLKSVFFLTQPTPGPEIQGSSCGVLDGQPTRLAAIEVRGEPAG